MRWKWRRTPPYRLVEKITASHRGAKTEYVIERRIFGVFWIWENAYDTHREAIDMLDRYEARWRQRTTRTVIARGQ